MKKLVLLILLLLVSCSNEVENKATEPVNINQEEAQVEVETEEVTLQPFEVQVIEKKWVFLDQDDSDWSIDKPYFNPLNMASNYKRIDFSPQTETYYSYIDDFAVRQSDFWYGDQYTLEVAFKDDFTEDENKRFMYDIEDYIKSLNGHILGRDGDSLAFVTLEGSQHWYGTIEEIDKAFLISLCKENFMPNDELVVIKTSDYEENRAKFTSYNTGDLFQTLILEKTGGEIYLNVYMDHLYGDYKRSFVLSRDYYENYGETFYINGLPSEEGPFEWVLEWSDETEEISLFLETNGHVEKIKHGEALGAIKVSAEYVGAVHALPTGGKHLLVDHPHFNYETSSLDKTPDGDHIIFLPSGYWDVVIEPKNKELVESFKSKMIPVNSGQLTEIIVPNSISQALKFSNTGVKNGLSIGQIKESNQEVSLRFTLLDDETQDVLANKDNTILHEGGQQAEILEIQPVTMPLDLVLLLDSSGSMKGQLEATQEAAKDFITKLPDDSKIVIVDFDTSVKLLEGQTKAQALNNIDKLQVGGATALYDAILVGNQYLENKSRPSLIVFTDGQDANLNDTGPGSQITYEEMVENLSSNIPIYTIGFGSNHDKDTLENISKNNNGEYFSASDQEALSFIFNAISSKLTNTYDLVYKRPKVMGKSDFPVISIVVDTSGSMSDGYEDSGEYGDRLIKVKNLLHEFVTKLPQDVSLQLSEFNDRTSIVQLNTLDKRNILKAIAELEAGGYTDIEGSIQVAYETLNEIPSSKKVLLYITDAALGTRDADEIMLDYLSEIKDSDIHVLWIGMGISEDEVIDFSMAADISGGDYIISTDVSALRDKVDNLLESILSTDDSMQTAISLTVEKENSLGSREAYSTSRLVELSPNEIGELASLDAVSFEITDMVSPYDIKSSQLLTGHMLHGEEVLITSRQKTDKKASNETCQIQVNEIFTLDKLAGVDAPYGYQYLALDVRLKNIMEAREVVVYPDGSAHPASWIGGQAKGQTVKKKIDYMIPNFVNHLYLSFNSNQVPASTVTWVSEKPLINPGQYDLTIKPDEIQEGILIFLVPKANTSQLSLHLYDTNYGHINLQITGLMENTLELEDLPIKASENLSDTFGLSINRVSSLDGFKDYELDENTHLLTVDASFTSNMQALLDIDPLERLKLELPSDNGSYYLDISPLTVEVPGGFIKETRLAPGAMNRVKWLFELPEALAQNEMKIFIDLKDQDKLVGVQEGTRHNNQLIKRYSFDYYDIDINDFILDESFIDISSKYALLDITVHEKKDGFSTSGVTDLFVLKTDEGDDDEVGLGNFATSSNEIYPGDDYNDFLLEIHEEDIFYDGQSRRGYIIFPIYDQRSWYLEFEGDRIEPQVGSIDDGLFARKFDYEEDDYYMAMMNEVISRVVEEYERMNLDESNSGVNYSIDLSYDEIAPPSISIYGEKIKSDIDSIEAMIELFKSYTCVPSDYFYDGFSNIKSTEAFLMEGYGCPGDFGNAAKEILSSLGYTLKLHELKLTERGKSQLKNMYGFDVKYDIVPGISFENKGQNRMLIMPFMVFADEYSDLAEITGPATKEFEENGLLIEVELEGIYTEKGLSQQMGDISDALAGEESDDHVIQSIFYDKVDLSALSQDCIEILIGSSGQSANVFVSSIEGELKGDNFNPNHYDIKRYYIHYYMIDGTKVTQTIELEDIPFNQILVTTSINQPNLSLEAGKYLKDRSLELYTRTQKPDPLTTLKWLSRKHINDLIYHQSRLEDDLSENLEVSSYRSNQTRIISLTHKFDGNQLISNMDILQPFTDVYGESSKAQSFTTMLGLMISDMEESILGSGIESIWSKLSDDAALVFLNYNDSKEDFLARLDMEEHLKNYLLELDKYILIPDKPALIDGKKRWAWLEFDDDYKVISVLDDYTHGSAESAIIDAVKNSAQYALGAFKGVETSMWSVAAFSLEESDYAVILKNAKSFALGISKKFGYSKAGVGGSVGGTISASQSLGPVKVTFNGKPDISQNSLGYTEGFVEGVKIYFDSAK
ncbi:VWA domain-containing protein [Acidaminobacter sp. JC074]|uniref:vWA domain-containing protein n=1 Tax=Acidaminobacter sp. JC074 TaxID=2530199 RepID=UPI001F1058EB|nr:VWA domain-containing protein [Acidaminobacter sp. JC074]MCH4889775.1 VWA domain-containing protein [Acidaminobacter sp. JC074]